MVKKDEGSEKKTASPRGRIMQVVEIEEEDTSKQKVDAPVPSEIVKSEEKPIEENLPEKVEKPDIASSFPVPDHTEEKPQLSSDKAESLQKDIPVLKNEDKRDIVSELFETKGKAVQYPDISLDKKQSRFGFLLWAVVLLGIVGIIGGGLLYLKNKSTSAESVSSTVETPTPTLEATPTETPVASVSGKPKATPTKSASPSATPKKTGLSIQVLNGSGKTGVASAMKKFLEEKGYNVVGTGNAANFDYEKTEIIIKQDKSSSLDKLKTDLSTSYSVGSTSATLDSTAVYDAQVIIGKE